MFQKEDCLLFCREMFPILAKISPRERPMAEAIGRTAGKTADQKPFAKGCNTLWELCLRVLIILLRWQYNTEYVLQLLPQGGL
jgi:hypothetical protein